MKTGKLSGSHLNEKFNSVLHLCLPFKQRVLKGLLIAFEGIEGAGKSFQAQKLYRRLRQENIPCILVHEPGGTKLGEKLRWLLKSQEMSPEAELFLFCAARAQLLSQVILPNLMKNKVIIADRFSPSTLAYQAYGRGLSLEDVQKINFLSTKGVAPQLIVLLDLPVEEGLKRKSITDRFESEGIEFHQRVREGYLNLAQAEPERWLVLDALLPPEKIASIIWERVNKLVREGG